MPLGYYYKGTKTFIQGLSSDVKPVAIEGDIFNEENTGRAYTYESGVWVCKVYDGSTTIQYFAIQDFATTNNTPAVVLSIPIAINKNYRILLDLRAEKSDFSSSRTGNVKSSFLRATGNVSRVGITSDLLGVLPAATVDIVANTSTQSADVTVTGAIATTINWRLTATSIFNT